MPPVLCFNCGSSAKLTFDGSPLCNACLTTILQPMTRCGTLQLSDGTPTDLDACPACGAERAVVLDTAYLGCPACYSAFRVAVRRLAAGREV
jgi:protein-arginine kinase activator protein McsA